MEDPGDGTATSLTQTSPATASAPMAATTPAAACHSIGGGKYNCNVWRTADSCDAAGNKVGTLNSGNTISSAYAGASPRSRSHSSCSYGWEPRPPPWSPNCQTRMSFPPA
jgi:hypothetical protein